MSNIIELQHIDFSYLGEGSLLSGTFTFNGPTRIASNLEGELNMINNADLCIERNGNFEGNINCHDIEVYGRFNGTLKSTGKVIAYPPAKISGKIEAKNLVIYPGATINIEGETIQAN